MARSNGQLDWLPPGGGEPRLEERGVISAVWDRRRKTAALSFMN